MSGRRGRLTVWLLALALCAPAACGGRAPLADEPPSVAVEADTALALRRRAEGFYLRLAHRRFNTLETFNDRIMREHFRSDALFLDYYADLAEALGEAHFEKRRPLVVEIQELRFEGASAARVQVRFAGDDDRPLRPGSVALLRVDRWQLADGAWWVEPGKL